MESSRNFIEKNFKCEICDMNFSTKMFMELPEISNAILVKNPSLHLEVCSIISRHSMTVREITNVILVENYSLNQKKHIKTVHEGERNYKCDSCKKPFTQSGIYENTKNVL